jgi:Tfp pilus assembly protein PilV
VTATADIGLQRGGKSRLVARFRDEEGIGLIELMIALLVLNVGIFATLAAFTSGALALRRASHASTAAAIADKYMESYRDSSYTSIPPACNPTPTSSTSSSTVAGADSLNYTLTVTASCGTQLGTGTFKGSSAVKVVTLTVKGPNPSTQVLDTSSSTFSECTQSALGTDTNPCQT